MTRGARSALEHAKRAAAIVAFFAVWWLVYAWLNARGSQPQVGHLFPAPSATLPWLYQPWTAWIYFFGGNLSIVLPFLWHWSRAGIRFVLTSYGVASLISFATYLLYPVRMIRPDYAGDSSGEWLMRTVVAADDPANCLPSSHAQFAILCALLVERSRAPRGAKTAVWLLAISIAVTTVTVGQHYFIDVAGGAAVALVGYSVAARWVAPAGAS